MGIHYIAYLYCLAVQTGYYSDTVLLAYHADGPGLIPDCGIGDSKFFTYYMYMEISYRSGK